MNYNFVAHIIRDTFGQPVTPTLLGNDATCMSDFRSDIHSLGFISLSLDGFINIDSVFDDPKSIFLDFTSENLIYLGKDYADLLLSINYDPDINYDIKSGGLSVEHLAHCLIDFVQSRRFIVLINPGEWFSKLSLLLRREDIEEKLRQFSIFKNERVFVYENL